MGEFIFMKNNIKEKGLINAMIKTFENISLVNNENVENNEYDNNIGTIYKSGIEESNKKLRFKERFKKRIKDGVVWCEKRTSMEVI